MFWATAIVFFFFLLIVFLMDKQFGIFLMCSRFPFVACEIFTCEIEMILQTLVEDEEVDIVSTISFYIYTL